ncbi:MAG TPA: zf-HC2 domain-containing protein [Pyrinomonadaceae bacterium]|nr:zf-HC2 domain-containing protein [Pyrinomonadaceae bacterium]
MRCTRVEKLLPLHVAGDLDKRRARAVANHLTACEACRLSASGYDASRDLLREATLPPDFDGAFYEEIRRSVLDQIKRDRTLAPPPSSIFASLFNARFAYAASLVFVALAFALAFHTYTRRTSDDSARDKMIADANREPAAQPTATTQTATTSLPKRRATDESAQNGVRPSFALTRRTPQRVKRNSPAPNVARATQANKEELAARGKTTTAEAAQSEVSRIEIQTSDPNIRIIWLAPKPDAVTQPLK